MPGLLSWVSYYLDKGFKLNYLLNLNEVEKTFFIMSMNKNIKERVEYDTEKLKALAGTRG